MTRSRTWTQPFTADEARRAKGDHTIAVCLPALNEEATVGTIVKSIVAELVDDAGVVDEVIVIDDGSTDDTAAVAREAGARVVPNSSGVHGKGSALWTSVGASSSDLIIWCDSDLEEFTTTYVLGLATPMLDDPSVMFVKGAFERPVEGGDVGGRVTELVARPILHLLHPGLAHIDQPLGGEYGGRRCVLESVPFVIGYGVELGLLLDIAARYGTDAIAQVELGTRVHRRRKLLQLEPQALEVMMVALDRAGIDVPERLSLMRRSLPIGTVSIDMLPPHRSPRD
ncbi:MAG: glucosyl-3-phosphoglycerate synthase [Acidimicrobiia bacterium]